MAHKLWTLTIGFEVPSGDIDTDNLLTDHILDNYITTCGGEMVSEAYETFTDDGCGDCGDGGQEVLGRELEFQFSVPPEFADEPLEGSPMHEAFDACKMMANCWYVHLDDVDGKTHMSWPEEEAESDEEPAKCAEPVLN